MYNRILDMHCFIYCFVLYSSYLKIWVWYKDFEDFLYYDDHLVYLFDYEKRVVYPNFEHPALTS